MIAEGSLNERIEKIGEIIYSDNVMAGHDHLVLLVIMNSAFRFYAQLIGALNRQSEKPGQAKLRLTTKFVKVTTQHMMEAVVKIDEVSHLF